MANFNYSSKSYVLTELMIFPSSGRSVDIMNIMTELTIFEDLWSPVVSGNVLLSDSRDLIALLPLTGFDFLSVKFTKPGNNDEIYKVFRIYKIDDVNINFDNLTSQGYRLRFCSEELLLSAQSKVYKSYKGSSSVDAIKDILHKYLKVSDNKFQEENFENTTDSYDFIIPGWSPFKAIDWISSTTVPPYVFYENRYGFNFHSLDSLLNQPSDVRYVYGPKNIKSDQTIEKELRTVVSYEDMKLFDLLDSTKNGLFASNLMTIDTIRQKFSNYRFSYQDWFDKNITIEPASFDPELHNRRGERASDEFGSMRMFYPTNLGQSGVKENRVESWLAQRTSQIEQLNYLKLKLVVPGDIEMSAGDMIQFDVPLVSKDNKLNPYYSGNYLLTAIRHKINFDHYEMVMECTKDSIAADYPTVDNQDPDLTSMREF